MVFKLPTTPTPLENLTITEKVTVKSSEPVLTLAPATPTAHALAFYQACHWHIERTVSGITATNNVTGDIYEGTIADFNQLLRGN